MRVESWYLDFIEMTLLFFERLKEERFNLVDLSIVHDDIHAFKPMPSGNLFDDFLSSRNVPFICPFRFLQSSHFSSSPLQLISRLLNFIHQLFPFCSFLTHNVLCVGIPLSKRVFHGL